MNTFKQDMNAPLQDCERWYLRLPVAIFCAIPLTFIFFIIGAVLGAIGDWIEFSVEVILGDN